MERNDSQVEEWLSDGFEWGLPEDLYIEYERPNFRSLIAGVLIGSAFWMVVVTLIFLFTTHPSYAREPVPLTLLASKTVVKVPQLEFVAPDGLAYGIPLSGTAPGRIFSGTLELSDLVPAGTGEFRIVPGTLVDLAGKSGTEITSGRYRYVGIVNPAPTAILIQDRRYNWATGRVEKP